MAWSVVEGFDEAEFVSGSVKESFEEAVAIPVGNESETIGQALAQRCFFFTLCEMKDNLAKLPNYASFGLKFSVRLAAWEVNSAASA